MTSPIFTVISSGQAVSGLVDLTQISPWAVVVPTITSGDLALQGSPDTSSANFVRLIETRVPSSADLRLPTGPGSRMVLFPTNFIMPPYAKLETLVPQTDVRTFALFTVPR